MRRFEASPRRATPKGHKPSSTAQHRHHPDPPTEPRLQRSWHTATHEISLHVQTPGLQRVGEPQELTRTLDARSRSHLTVTSATLDTPALVWPIGRYRAPNPSETKEKLRWSIHGAQAGARGVLGCRKGMSALCARVRALTNDVKSARARCRAI